MPAHDPPTRTDPFAPTHPPDPVTASHDATGPTTPDAAPPADHLPDIPGYAVEAEIARGGMGVVYRARHLKLNRPAAIKMILGGRYHDPIARVRFLVEAEAVAALDHPHVVPVHEFGTHDGLPFFALEYVAGGTLAQKLRRDGKPTPRAAAELVVKLADAIAAAHARGIVHRDLKPANVLLTEAGEPKVADFGLAKIGQSDMTGTGSVLGTPSYMSPEQAAGRVREVGTHSDVYSLGAILYELLTGRPAFRAETATATIQLVLTTEPARPRALDAAVPRDLETIALKCLAKEPSKRYATADALAADLRAYLAGRPITARPVGAAERTWKWVKRNPGRAAAVLAGLLVVGGAGVAAFQVQRALFAAETKRLEDLRTADETARQKQREAKAEALVRALAVAEPGAVPVLLRELAEYRDLARPELVVLAARPSGDRSGLRARLALVGPKTDSLDRDKSWRGGLIHDALDCRSDDLPILLDHLDIWTVATLDGLLDVLQDQTLAQLRPQFSLRLATIRARLDPNGHDWPSLVAPTVDELVRLNPLEAEPFIEGLRPARDLLTAPLLLRYAEARRRIESGQLTVSELTAEATSFTLTATVLARYTADRPTALAELAVGVDARHYQYFTNALHENRAAVVPLLKAELGRRAVPAWADDGGTPLAVVVGAAVIGGRLDPSPLRETAAKRRGNAAAALLTLGEAEAAWQLLRFPADGDPTARSYLLERLAWVHPTGMDLVRRFEAETDVSAKRALLVTLGDYPIHRSGEERRDEFARVLLSLYRDHPDPGLHSAIEWGLRQKWGKATELAAIDSELTAAAKERPGGQIPAGKDWFVTGEGQTFAVVRGPVAFTMGSPPTEPGRFADEAAHRKRIDRTFAIATKEVTVAEYLRCRANHDWTKRYSPGPDTPAVGMSWYEAAGYCNWLSEQAGIPPDQWCYEPNKAGVYGPGMRIKPGHLALTGYRLPTEAEWEYACRAGAATARYFGRGDELLSRYGWFMQNADDRTHPVGQLRPNDLGLFDMLGNAQEWVSDPKRPYDPTAEVDREHADHAEVTDRVPRGLRGGSFLIAALHLRSADRNHEPPGRRFSNIGFRPARTLP